MKSIAADVLVVCGIGLLALAGFLVATPLGLCVVGCPMVYIGVRLAEKNKK